MQEEKINLVNEELDQIISDIQNLQKLKEKTIVNLCAAAVKQHQSIQKLVNVSSPVTIVGNIHGQFLDLLEIFAVGGRVPDTNYLFLGDYVNLGQNSIECLVYLLALKLRYPSRITLLRGNNEVQFISKIYGFYDECLSKYGSLNIWHSLTSVFDFLPLGAVVENKVFCVHSGLSPQISEVNQILSVRSDEKSIEDQGPAYHLLCNEPDEVDGDWCFQARNSIIQIGYFGKSVTKQFLEQNKFSLLIRANDCQQSGYSFMHDRSICSIFSAPNIRESPLSLGSFFELDETLDFTIQQFQPTSRQQQLKGISPILNRVDIHQDKYVSKMDIE